MGDRWRRGMRGMGLGSVQSSLEDGHRNGPGSARVVLGTKASELGGPGACEGKTGWYCDVLRTLVRPLRLETEWA